MDCVLIISNNNFEEHLDKVKNVLLKKLKSRSGIQNQCRKIVRDNLEYLGFKITRQGTMPQSEKVQARKDVAVPTNKNQLIIIEICGNTDQISYFLLLK